VSSIRYDARVDQAKNTLDSWLAEQNAAIGQLSASSLGFSASKLRPDWLAAFRQSLLDNGDATRLVRELLPKCRFPALAVFVVLGVSTPIEARLNADIDERGDKLKSRLRVSARKRKRSGQENLADHYKLLVNAGHAFDTRRRGLAEYCEVALVIREYLYARSGLRPTPRELAAVLEAGLVASGKPKFWQKLDYDLLGRNLKNFEKKHEARCAFVRKMSIDIIEGKVPAARPTP
jgi:hypothetical protein